MFRTHTRIARLGECLHVRVWIVGLVAALQVGQAQASHFTKSPYLQAPGPDTMTLLWESQENLPAVVRYGAGPSLDRVQEVASPKLMAGVSTRYATNVVADLKANPPTLKTNVVSYSVTNVFYVYEARLSPLRPDTAYSYVVQLGAESSPVARFRTFGRSPAEVRFIAYGDSRSNPREHAIVARQFLRHRPDFILHTGDLVARGTDYSLWSREFFDPLAGVIDHVPLLPAIGNHEENGTNYLTCFHLPAPERWYSFDLGPVHVLALDFHYERASDAQFAFAQQDLRSSQAPWKIVFLHFPMFNVGGHATTWGHEAYLPLFHETHVDLVLGGHSHIYERFLPTAPERGASAWPIVNITTGGGGAPLYSVYNHPALACYASTNHYVFFDATAERLRGWAYLTSGKVLDRFELRKAGPEHAPAWTSPVYPEEWLRTYFQAAPILQGQLSTVPSNGAPAQVTFTLKPLTNAPGPVDLEIRLAPDSQTNYLWDGPPLHVRLPDAGAPQRLARAQVRSSGRKAVSAKPGADLDPPLVFEARLQSGALDVTARGARSILAPTASGYSGPTNAIALAVEYPTNTLSKILLPRDQWRPFPKSSDRRPWLALPEAARQELVQRGEAALAQPVPPLPASLYLEYALDGNRSHFESVYFDRRRLLHQLVLAECAEGKGRFLEGIANALWALCEESSWCLPAHVSVQKAGVGLPDIDEPIVDLFAAQTSVSVAWTLYLVGPELDRVSPRVRARASREVNRRILEPVLARDFGWMGFGATNRAARPNNWNPWINASVVTAALVLEENEARRVQLVHRVLRSLDQFLQPYPEDGACDEGPGYWARAGGSVLDTLDLLFDATHGKLNDFAQPIIREMGRFIYRVHIAGDWFVDIGDCPAKTGLERDLIFRYGRAIGDRRLQDLATSGATLPGLLRETDSIDLGRSLHTLFDLPDILAQSDARPPLIRDAWLGSEDMQMMVARDQAGSTQGWFVAAWGGHNGQSHNHNDVGNCVVFADGQPVLVDMGAPTYTAQTFSSRRYDIPAMQSACHNLPTINGVQQSAGRDFAAQNVEYSQSDSAAELRMDIARAWPAEAGVASWVRQVRLERGHGVRIVDAFKLKELRGETSLHWLTPLSPRLDGPGRLLLPLPKHAPETHSAVALQFDPDRLVAEVQTLALNDERLEKIWGPHLFRIVLRPKNAALQGTWTVGLRLLPTE
jgi:hypothetical protein